MTTQPRQYESPSSLQRYQKCPHSYYLRYLAKSQKAEPGQPARFGTYIHEVLSSIYDFVIQCKFNGQLDDRFIRGRARELADKHQIGTVQSEEAYALVKRYLACQGSLEHQNHLSTELEYDFDLPGIGMTKVIMDRIDRDGEDGILVVDYKSGKDWNDYHTQIYLYLYAAKHMHDWALTSRFRIDFLRLGTSREFTVSAGQLAVEIDRIIDVKKKITAGHFEPVIGIHCRWCDVRSSCAFFQSSKKGK